MQRPSVHHPIRWAFTAVELVIGLAILSITSLALAATMSSVGQGWLATRQTHGAVMAQHTAGLRIERLIGSSKQVLVGQVGDLLGLSSPAMVSLWVKDDAQFGSIPELYETALLVHNRQDQKLYLYEFKERNLINNVKVLLPDLLGLLPQLEAVTGNGLNLFAVRKRTIATDVKHAAFWHVPAADGGRPSVEFVLKTTDGRSIYGTATLKANK